MPQGLEGSAGRVAGRFPPGIATGAPSRQRIALPPAGKGGPAASSCRSTLPSGSLSACPASGPGGESSRFGNCYVMVSAGERRRLRASALEAGYRRGRRRMLSTFVRDASLGASIRSLRDSQGVEGLLRLLAMLMEQGNRAGAREDLARLSAVIGVLQRRLWEDPPSFPAPVRCGSLPRGRRIFEINVLLTRPAMERLRERALVEGFAEGTRIRLGDWMRERALGARPASLFRRGFHRRVERTIAAWPRPSGRQSLRDLLQELGQWLER